MSEELIRRLEVATPSRWVTFWASFGVWMAFGLVSALLGNKGYERAADVVGNIGLIAALITWWEIRYPVRIIAALKAKVGGDG